MPTATLTSKGQTTIPREVRNFLKLNPGDKMEFKLDPDGQTVILRAANIQVTSLRGMLKGKDMKPYNPEERKAAFRKRAHKK
jgi:AbrB family looped-hinge helix DNA binding protein